MQCYTALDRHLSAGIPSITMVAQYQSLDEFKNYMQTKKV